MRWESRWERKKVEMLLENQKYGKLTTVSREESLTKSGEKVIYWKCRCECGNETLVRACNLATGHTKSCGCLRPHNDYKHMKLEGEKFGRLLVISKFSKGRFTYLHCKCECGNEIDVRADALYRGSTISCGCYHKEKAAFSSKSHGKSKTKIYALWQAMIQRCENPNSAHYELYGGRGIKVCEEWKRDFLNFYKWSLESGYVNGKSRGECTLDRVDVNGNYEPGNCRWVNQTIQSNNTRRNRYITFNGETHTVAEWSRLLGIPYERLITRINRGWQVERAFKS